MFKPGDIVEWIANSHSAAGSVGVVAAYKSPGAGGVTVDWLTMTPAFTRECAERGERWAREGWVEEVFKKIGELPQK